ncbi:MAG TPA: ATP-binding protein [Chitinophagaceae bacterium]|nr:ATP-binding protein [Chitinophagaceae bacterium]
MAGFILTILFLYRKKQISHHEHLNQMQADFEKNLMKTQLEMQEQTFQNISREIHDNISLSLTLAKLHLHMLDWNDREKLAEKINSSIELLSHSIHDLSDISKGLNAEIISQQGLIKSLEREIQFIRDTKLFGIDYRFTGSPVYLDAKKELIIFRIVQEAFNNIIKHAGAVKVKLRLHYTKIKLYIIISDDGKGFDAAEAFSKQQAGLRNMETRVKMLTGNMTINSLPGQGTTLSFKIPIEDHG